MTKRECEKKTAAKVGCYAVIFQPHVVYCNVCKAVDGTHFARNWIRGLAYRDKISVMADIREIQISAALSPMVRKTCDCNCTKIS